MKRITFATRVLAKLKLTGMAAMALSFIMMMVLAGCPTEDDSDPGPDGRTYTVTANGSVNETTTALTITIAAGGTTPLSELSAEEITITNGTGKAVKNGDLISGEIETAYTLPVTVTQAGTITVKIIKDGVDSNDHSVTVYYKP
jgi:hypothetical protein